MMKTILAILALTTYFQLTLQRNPHREQMMTSHSGQNQMMQHKRNQIQNFRSSMGSNSPQLMRQSQHHNFGSQKNKTEDGERASSCRLKRYNGDLRTHRRATRRGNNRIVVGDKQPAVKVDLQGSQKGKRITPTQILDRMNDENKKNGLKELGLVKAISMTSLTESIHRDRAASLDSDKAASLGRERRNENQKGKKRSGSWSSLKSIGGVQFATGKTNPVEGLKEIKSKLLGGGNKHKPKKKNNNKKKNKNKSEERPEDTHKSYEIKQLYQDKMKNLQSILMDVIMGKWGPATTVRLCGEGKKIAQQLCRLAEKMVAEMEKGAVFPIDPKEWIVTCSQAEETLTQKQRLAMGIIKGI